MTPPSFSLLPGLDAVAVAGKSPATSSGAGFDAALAGTGFGPTKTGQGSRSATTADATSQLPFASARSGGAPIVLAQTAAASSPPAARLIADTYGLATAMPATSTLGAPLVPSPPSPATAASNAEGSAPVPGDTKTESTDTAVSPAIATPAPTAKLALADLTATPAIGNQPSQTALPATTTPIEADAKPSTPTTNGTGDAASPSIAAKPAPGSASANAILASKTASPPSPKSAPIAPATAPSTSVRGAVKDTRASEDETVADRTLPSTTQPSPSVTTVPVPTAVSPANPATTPAPTVAVPATATTTTGRAVTATRGGKAGVTQTEPDEKTAPSSALNVENLGTAEKTPALDAAAPTLAVLATPPANAVAQMAAPHQAGANFRSDDDATPPSSSAGRTALRSIAASPDAVTPTQAEPTDSATPFAPLLKPDALPAGTPIVGQQADTAPALPSAVTPVHAQVIPTAASAQPLATASTPTPVTTTVTVTPTPGQMGHDIGVAIARHVRTDGGEAMTVRLDPRDLGRIEVRMHFDDDGVLRAVVSADNPASLDLLRRDSADLNRALGDAGVRADQQSLRFDTRAGTGGGTGSGGNGTADGQPRQHQPASPYYSDDADADGGADIDPVWRPLNPRGRIDLMA
ncbi:flagellar hook-length control protein FliK [Sphingomonas sp. PP-CE-3A-406]|nr:flagellar hook-length control protein FliK [Sphingomonas sp. PP-CE-3A-406]